MLCNISNLSLLFLVFLLNLLKWRPHHSLQELGAPISSHAVSWSSHRHLLHPVISTTASLFSTTPPSYNEATIEFNDQTRVQSSIWRLNLKPFRSKSLFRCSSSGLLLFVLSHYLLHGGAQQLPPLGWRGFYTTILLCLAFVGGSASKKRAQVFWLRGLPAFYPSEVWAALCDIQREFSRLGKEAHPSSSTPKPYFPVSKTYM